MAPDENPSNRPGVDADPLTRIDFGLLKKPVNEVPAEDPHRKLKLIAVVIFLLYLAIAGLDGRDALVMGIKFNLLLFAVIMISMSVHEFSHAWMANSWGDPTARDLGRMSLNPLVHVDWIGLLCFFIGGYGWAKPVPVRPNNFRDLDRGMIMVSLAGPLSNLVLAFLGGVFLRIGTPWLKALASVSPLAGEMTAMFILLFIVMNVGVALFNLLPVPPLDGSKILMHWLPEGKRGGLAALERSGEVLLLFLVASGVTRAVITPLAEAIVKVIMMVVGAHP